jgi:HlyD family secretion protein
MIGMTVDVDIVVGQRSDALLVPASAVVHGPSQGGKPGAPFVFVVDQARARRVEVKTGAVGTAKVEIADGLKDGDRVILNPSDRLRDGEAIRVSP